MSDATDAAFTILFWLTTPLGLLWSLNRLLDTGYAYTISNYVAMGFVLFMASVLTADEGYMNTDE